MGVGVSSTVLLSPLDVVLPIPGGEGTYMVVESDSGDCIVACMVVLEEGVG